MISPHPGDFKVVLLIFGIGLIGAWLWLEYGERF
jgi:hypothetical protein